MKTIRMILLYSIIFALSLFATKYGRTVRKEDGLGNERMEIVVMVQGDAFPSHFS